MFRSTPPRGGRHHRQRKRRPRRGFDPRPRAGGDRQLWAEGKTGSVSIHAPARGATRQPVNALPAHEFRSTPPRGGRPCGSAMARTESCFDPRPRAGGDPAPRFNDVVQDVSIHAPARGATRRLWLLSLSGVSFDPRPRAGGDLWQIIAWICERSFDPRPRAGGDRLVVSAEIFAVILNGCANLTRPQDERRPSRPIRKQHIHMSKIFVLRTSRGNPACFRFARSKQ